VEHSTSKPLSVGGIEDPDSARVTTTGATRYGPWECVATALEVGDPNSRNRCFLRLWVKL
jgi:hypothetical protein